MLGKLFKVLCKWMKLASDGEKLHVELASLKIAPWLVCKRMIDGQLKKFSVNNLNTTTSLND